MTTRTLTISGTRTSLKKLIKAFAACGVPGLEIKLIDTRTREGIPTVMVPLTEVTDVSTPTPIGADVLMGDVRFYRITQTGPSAREVQRLPINDFAKLCTGK